MSLQVNITGFRSADLMGLHDVELEVVERPCPVGDDPESVVLVKNGALEMSYSPAFNHYYFSRLPSEKWFSSYYSSEWMTGDIRKNQSSFVKSSINRLKPLYRTLRSTVQNICGTTSSTQIAVDADIRRYFMILKPYLLGKGKVLDIGCGTGEFLQPYLKDGVECFGIEPSEMNSKTSRRRGINTLTSSLVDTPEVRHMIANADVVFSNHSLEHHYEPNRLFALCSEEMAEGKILSVTVPNSEVEILMLQNLFLLHIDGYTNESLEAMFNKYGFEVILKEIGGQLRFVAIKRGRPIERSPRKLWDFKTFQDSYINKYLEQIFISDDAVKSGKNLIPFSFGYKGGRPFTKWSSNLYTKDIPKDVGRFVDGEITFLSGTQPAVVTCITKSPSHSRIMLK